MQARSTSPATLTYPAGYGVLGCACLLVLVSPNYCMRIGHPGHPGGSRHTGRKRFHGFRAPDTYGGPRHGSHSAQQARRRGLSCRHFFVVSSFCCIIIQVKLKVVVLEHGALVHGGRVVVLSSRCGERYAWRARGRARGG